jgi:hypothetical protein
MEAPRLSLSITREKWFPVFAKNDAQTAAAIQTQAWPEFGKIDAQAKRPSSIQTQAFAGVW